MVRFSWNQKSVAKVTVFLKTKLIEVPTVFFNQRAGNNIQNHKDNVEIATFLPTVD